MTGWLNKLRLMIRSVRMRRPGAIFGRLDAPGHVLRPAARAVVRGWAIDAGSGAAVAVRVLVGGKTISPLFFPRDDVVRALPGRPVSVDCGFWTEIDLSPGLQWVRVEVLSMKGWRFIGARLIVGRSAPIADQPLTYAKWKSADSALLLAETDEIKRHIASTPRWPSFTVVVGQDGDEELAAVEKVGGGGAFLAPEDVISFKSFLIHRPRSDFFVFIDSGDRLRSDTLYRFAAAHIADPSADIFYGDEEVRPFGSAALLRAKPDWSPDAFRHADYVRSCACLRGSLTQSAQFEDRKEMFLKVFPAARRIVHLRRVLSEVASRPEVHSTGSSTVALTASKDDRQCAAISATAPTFVSITTCEEAMSLYAAQKGVEVTIAPWAPGTHGQGTNFQEAWLEVNQTAHNADSDYIVFSAGGVPDDEFALRTLAACFESEVVGAVGPKRITTDAVEHGMMFRYGAWVPVIEPRSYEPSAEILGAVRNVSALRFDGLVVRTQLFRQLGGFGPAESPDLSAAGLCERMQEKGFSVISVPIVSVIVSDKGVVRPGADRRLWSVTGHRPHSKMTRDPYYNDWALAGDPADFRTAFASPRL